MNRSKALQSSTLIIFDCDGVLVDSEVLSAGVLTALLRDAGFGITPEIFRGDFLGRSFSGAAERVRKRFGKPLPEGFEAAYRKELLAAMEQGLRPMADVEAMLRGLNCPYCLATSSSPQRLAVSLGVTGLAPYFAGRCFTTLDVERGKPAPDLFLHAAARMGVAPERCIVVEDSELGVSAGLAAGMTVWHFAGGAHVTAGYGLPPTIEPHRRIGDMLALKTCFEELGLC
jgi:HAD superfamily hydrolase (TIGR01509 family)